MFALFVEADRYIGKLTHAVTVCCVPQDCPLHLPAGAPAEVTQSTNNIGNVTVLQMLFFLLWFQVAPCHKTHVEVVHYLGLRIFEIVQGM